MTGLLRPGVRLGPLALLLHQGLEALGVHLQALLGGHLDGQIDREAVRVVQLERLRALELVGTAGLGLADGDVEDARPGRQSPAERLLLGVRDLADPAEVGLQLGVRLLHLLQADRQQLDQARVLVAEQAHRADRAAEQPPQHVAALLVARGDAVADQHQCAADVVGDHPEPHVVHVLDAVLAAAQVRRPLDHRVDLVDLVHVVDALQQVRDALEAETGVDVLLRQLAEDLVAVLAATLTADVLHEDQVPELQVAVARLPVPVGAELRAAVDQDLRARAARAGDAHRPEVVLHAEPDDPVVGQAGDPLPQVDRLVVVVVDRRVEHRLVEAVAAVALGPGDQVPGVLDRLLLEVVAEGEVAVHLEERAVPGGLADLVDVEGPDALLHAGRPRVRRRLLAEEVRARTGPCRRR